MPAECGVSYPRKCSLSMTTQHHCILCGPCLSVGHRTQENVIYRWLHIWVVIGVVLCLQSVRYLMTPNRIVPNLKKRLLLSGPMLAECRASYIRKILSVHNYTTNLLFAWTYVAERSASLLEVTKEVLYIVVLLSESNNDGLFLFVPVSAEWRRSNHQYSSTVASVWYMMHRASSSSTTTPVLEQGVGRCQLTYIDVIIEYDSGRD